MNILLSVGLLLFLVLLESCDASNEKKLRKQDFKLAMAGGMAGAMSTLTLHPIDTAKTLRQSNPEAFSGTIDTMSHMIRMHGPLSLYAGVGTAVLGSIPSSALYFGAYESTKARLNLFFNNRLKRSGFKGDSSQFPFHIRSKIHLISAICGNAASSLVFVPKEFLKQTIQAQKGAAARGQVPINVFTLTRTTLRQHGIKGLYCGYWATLSRNVPSAVLRFTFYEELKLLLRPYFKSTTGSFCPAYIVAGALAGAISSGITTPFDVIKTQIATGRLERNLGILGCASHIISEQGVKGLYVGLQPRMMISSLFTAVGFSAFETMKTVLRVNCDESKS